MKKRILAMLLSCCTVVSMMGPVRAVPVMETVEAVEEVVSEPDVPDEEAELQYYTSSMSGWSSSYTLTGDMAADIVSVAAAQVGRNGSTLAYNDQWCAYFVSDCARLAGISTSIIGNSARANPTSFGLTATDKSSYTPKSGDLIFYDWPGDNTQWDHVELVEYVSNGYVHTIGGNSGDGSTLSTREVKRNCYALNSDYIKAYAVPDYRNETYATLSSINDSSVFLKQATDYTCTLASATMMVRRRAIANGNSNWTSITESAMRSIAWLEGTGLYNNFTYAGISVTSKGISSSKKSTLISYLQGRPEGIVVYDFSVPHAVLLTDYDSATDTFYCADPSNYAASGRIPFANATTKGSGQSGKIEEIDKIWYITTTTSYTENNPSISYSTLTPGNYYFVNNSSYLTVNGDNNSSVCKVTSYAGDKSQQFAVSANSRFTNGYTLKTLNYSSGRVLNVFTDYSSSNGDSVTLYTLTSDASQTWKFEAVSGGYIIHPADNTSLALTNSSGSTKVMTSTGASNQIWSLVSADAQYNFDVNGYVDGEYKTGLNGYVTFDVYINGSLVKKSVGDFCTAYPNGTTYEVKNIQAATGYIYNSGEGLSGTINGDHAYANLNLSTVTYNVTYNANGGSGAPSAQKKYYGSNLTLSSTVPTRAGYTFAGWIATDSSFYQAGETYSANAATTLTAYWTRIRPEKPIINLQSEQFTEDQKLQISWNKVENCDYYEFHLYDGNTGEHIYSDYKVLNTFYSTDLASGYYKAHISAINMEIADDGTFTNSDSVYFTVSPKYYLITYDVNGGSDEPSEQTKPHNTTSIVLSYIKPTRTGYTFTGWKATNGTVYQPGDLYTVNEDTTLTAQWKSNNVSVTGVTLNKSAATLTVGDTEALTATVAPANATNKNVTWSSSNTSVATVSSAGKITAKASGTATITVKTADGSKTATCEVTVKAKESEKPAFVVSTVKGTAGSTVSVTLSLKNNPGIVAVKVKLAFDTSVLTLTEVKDAGVLGSTMHNPTLGSPYTLYWFNGTATENYTVNGVAATLVFEIKDGAAVGHYPITATTDSENIYNADMDEVEFGTVSGEVEVIDVVLGDLNGDGKVNVKDNMMLARYLAEWAGYDETTVDLAAADLNGDGKVNVKDNMILARHLAEWAGYETLPVVD